MRDPSLAPSPAPVRAGTDPPAKKSRSAVRREGGGLAPPTGDQLKRAAKAGAEGAAPSSSTAQRGGARRAAAVAVRRTRLAKSGTKTLERPTAEAPRGATSGRGHTNPKSANARNSLGAATSGLP